MKDINFELLIPKNHLLNWDAAPPRQPNCCFKTTYDIKTFHGSLPLGVNELSGSFGNGWIIWNVGSREFSPAITTNHFSWHYHPDDVPAFSYQDWYTFLKIPSPITLLITNSKINIYIKKDMGLWKSINNWINNCSINKSKFKTLKFLKFCRVFNSEINSSIINNNKDRDICKLLGISFIDVNLNE